MDSTKIVTKLKDIKSRNPGISFLMDMMIKKFYDIDMTGGNGDDYSMLLLSTMQMLEGQLDREDKISLLNLAEEYAIKHR